MFRRSDCWMRFGAPPLDKPACTQLVWNISSVKTNTSGDGKELIQTQPGGRFTATNVTLRQLIRRATVMRLTPMVALRAACASFPAPSWRVAGGATLTELADGLSTLVDRVVLDRTGLADRFVFTLAPRGEPDGEGARCGQPTYAHPDQEHDPPSDAADRPFLQVLIDEAAR